MRSCDPGVRGPYSSRHPGEPLPTGAQDLDSEVGAVSGPAPTSWGTFLVGSFGRGSCGNGRSTRHGDRARPREAQAGPRTPHCTRRRLPELARSRGPTAQPRAAEGSAPDPLNPARGW